MKNLDNSYILDFLEESFPDTLPLVRVDEFELGRLIGQQELINKLKQKLEIESNKEEEIK